MVLRTFLRAFQWLAVDPVCGCGNQIRLRMELNVANMIQAGSAVVNLQILRAH